MAKQTFTTGSVLTATQMNDLQTNDFNWTVNQKTTSYVLVASDKGTRIEMNSGSATTVTVNTGLFAAGDTLFIQNIGTGVCTVTAGTATVNRAANASLALAQWQGGYLYFISASSAIFFADAGFTSPLTTKGDLFTWDTSNQRLAVGANDTVLTADSTTGTGLKWAAPAASYTQIATGTLSSTVVNITTIPATYQALRLVIRQHRPATDNRGINLYFNADTNTRYDSQAAFSADSVVFSGSSFVIGAANDDTTATGLTVVDIPDYYNTTTWKMCQTMSISVNPSTTTNYNWRFQFGVYNQTAAISQLNILGGTGSSFTSGTYILYGIK